MNLALTVKYFIRAIDGKDSTYLNAIQYPQKSGLYNSTINISSKFNLNGYNVLNTGPFCIHD